MKIKHLIAMFIAAVPKQEKVRPRRILEVILLACIMFTMCGHKVNTDMWNDEPALYPNPASDKITVEFQNTRGASIHVTDLKGRNIKSIALKKDKTELNVSDLPPGNYILQIKTNEVIGIKKIVVQH